MAVGGAGKDGECFVVVVEWIKPGSHGQTFHQIIYLCFFKKDLTDYYLPMVSKTLQLSFCIFYIRYMVYHGSSRISRYFIRDDENYLVQCTRIIHS